MTMMPFPPSAPCKRVGVAWFLLACAITGCGSLVPYADEFQCPGTYRGLCEPPVDAYKDSVHGIEPHRYNQKWQEARKAWEENNPELFAARAKVSTFNNAATGDNPAGYRELLFMRMRDQVESPVVPALTPAETVRCLVLDSLGRKDGSLYTPPHYVHFIMEPPRWTLQKIPELQAHNNFDSMEVKEDDYKALFPAPSEKPITSAIPSPAIEQGGKTSDGALEDNPVAARPEEAAKPTAPESTEMEMIRQFVDENEGASPRDSCVQ